MESQELIALEAAAAGVAVVATDNLEDPTITEIAVRAPYLDQQATAAAILSVVEDTDRRRDQVETARAVAQRHHDVSVGGPTLLEVLLP